MTRIALVTGANRGIGFEVARQLVDRGLQVIVAGRDANRVTRAATELRQQGGEVAELLLDVADRASIAAAVEDVLGRFGRLDVLVNNAAVYLDEGVSVFDLSAETMELTMRTNLYGPLALCQAFVPGMAQRNYGRVVNVSSESGSLSGMGGRTAAYAMSKAALNALTRVVAAETRGRNVKVNAICPGWVRTEMGGPAAPRSVAEGAASIVWAAMLPDDGPTGGFFRDGRSLPW